MIQRMGCRYPAMRRKSQWVFLVLAVVVLVGAAYYLGVIRVRKGAGPIRAANLREFLQKRGEGALRKRTAMTLVVVYERMLARYPDNLELKKKLAAAYTEAGQPEKAGPLLNEIAKSEQKAH